MNNEIKLTGGRITSEVVRKGDLVYRSMCANSPFVHDVLNFLEANGITFAPCFRGIDSQNREIISYINGKTPANLGLFTTEQCCQATAIIRALHDNLRLFPNCPAGLTVCHNDLSRAISCFLTIHLLLLSIGILQHLAILLTTLLMLYGCGLTLEIMITVLIMFKCA